MAVNTTTQPQAAPVSPAPSATAAEGQSSVGQSAVVESNLDSLLDAALGPETEAPIEQETPEESDENEDSEDTDENEDTEAESEDEEAEQDEDEDDEVPDGMENLPKGIVKRIKKQSAQIRELKAKLAEATPIQIAAGPTMPLADIATTEDLTARLETAKAVRKWCQANSEGGSIQLKNGQTVELDADEVARRLGLAEADIEAAPDRKMYLQQREQAKPWEAAKSIAPGLFENGTPENTFMLGLLKACPELTKLNDYEVVVAAAAKGFRITVEERSGKARYVRMALDEKGNIIPPKAKPDPKAAKTLEKPKSKPPVTPAAGRPNLRSAGATKSLDQIYTSTKGNPSARVDALLDAALGIG